MAKLIVWLAFCALTLPVLAQDPNAWLTTLPQPQDYVQHRASSHDRSGGNADFRIIAPGETLTVMDESGPGLISHVWFTIATSDPDHLKALVLRMYWDGESSPSVESPIGDFFGLGLGEYFMYESGPLSVGSQKALNSYFPMPFRRSAKITITNDGPVPVGAFYFNIDWQKHRTLPQDVAYFYAEYRQATPTPGWSADWKLNSDAKVNTRLNTDGKDNYVIVETEGKGHFVGVTHSIFQNQGDWWGEGDDMMFIDDNKTPHIVGTGSEEGHRSDRTSQGGYVAPQRCRLFVELRAHDRARGATPGKGVDG